MRRLLGVLLILTLVSFGQTRKRPQSTQVTSEMQRPQSASPKLCWSANSGMIESPHSCPLHAASMSNDVWLVEGAVKDKEGRPQVGGGFGVWVNKHDGCVSVMERMK
jgi:hypothetical protein